jgi:RHS repeat-associated protein
MIMPGRKYSSGSQYRYGFNGKENDNEVKGEGNEQDYGMRIYDPRLGRFLSVDPLSKSYPWNSPYSYAEGDVIRSIDLDGLEKYVITNYYNKFEQLDETMITVVTDKETGAKHDMNLKYDKGNHKGESVSQGYDVLVRNVRENAQGKITTSYSRKGEDELTSTENGILNSKGEGVSGVSPFRPGFGGKALDGGESVTGSEPGFDDSKFEQSMYRQKFYVAIPPPPTQNNINAAVNNLAAQIDLNTDKLNPASINAAKSLGKLLLSSANNSANLNVTFFDPSGTSSFMNRPATNGSTFGNNANAQIRAMADIIKQQSGVNIQFNSVDVTPIQGQNGATLKLNP